MKYMYFALKTGRANNKKREREKVSTVNGHFRNFQNFPLNFHRCFGNENKALFFFFFGPFAVDINF